MRVIDSQGGIPDVKSAMIRFTGGVVSLLFIFPVVGYFLIPFRKNKRGFNDLLADTLVVTKHAGRKNLFAWLGMGPMVAVVLFMSVFTGYRFVNEFHNGGEMISLDTVWDVGGSAKYESYKLSKDGCLIATATGLSFLNIFNGDTLWNIEGLDFPRVMSVTKDTAEPLLITHKSDSTGCMMVAIDERNGKLLWQRKLEGKAWWKLSVDTTGIIAYSDLLVIAFSASGDSLWKRMVSFADTAAGRHRNVSVELAGNHVVVNKYGEGATVKEVWDHATGEVIISGNDNIRKFFRFGEMYSIIIDTSHMWVMRNTLSGDTVWKCRDRTDYPVSCRYDSCGNPRMIYGRKQAYNASDGTVAFSYPDGMVFESLPEKYLMVIAEPKFGSGSSGLGGGEYRFIDPLTGDERYSLSDTTLSTLVLIGEDEEKMFFAARPAMNIFNKTVAVNIFRLLFPSEEMKKTLQRYLVTINKKNFAQEMFLVGSSVSLEQARILPGSGRIFISGLNRAGLYVLPSAPSLADASAQYE